jgi:hypothetical protein
MVFGEVQFPHCGGRQADRELELGPKVRPFREETVELCGVASGRPPKLGPGHRAGNPLQVDGTPTSLDEPVVHHYFFGAMIQRGKRCHYARNVVRVNQLEQRAAVDLLRSYSEQAREGIVDFPQISVAPGDREQLYLGAFRARQIRMAKGSIDGYATLFLA